MGFDREKCAVRIMKSGEKNTTKKENWRFRNESKLKGKRKITSTWEYRKRTL